MRLPWGYPELVLDKGDHYVDLIEREPKALAIFARRREEINAEFQETN
jgi:hypothetical protein